MRALGTGKGWDRDRRISPGDDSPSFLVSVTDDHGGISEDEDASSDVSSDFNGDSSGEDKMDEYEF